MQTDLAERLIAAAGLVSSEPDKLAQAMQRFVSRCETGERRVDVAELWIICKALNISFRDFTATLDDLFTASEKE